jgi:hypothetical protein
VLCSVDHGAVMIETVLLVDLNLPFRRRVVAETLLKATAAAERIARFW